MRKLLWLLACLAIAAGFAAPAAANSGYIHDLAGSVTVRSGNGAPRALRVGDLIDRNQTISTGDNSSAVVKFEDGQVVALSARASFTVQDYHYDKQNISASRAVFNVIQGGLRFITGVIGATNRNAVSLRAGATTTIGIRGTDVVIHVDAVTQAVTTAVNNGAIAFTSVVGTPVLAQAGQVATQVPGLAPVIVGFLSAVAGALPGTVSASIANLNAATNIPINTPVNVQVSSRAVALTALARAQPGNAALQQQAAAALQEAVVAATQALSAAISAGGNTPVPAQSPTSPTSTTTPTTTTTTTETTDTTTGTTGSTTTPSSGSGSGGGGGTASPN